MDAVRLQAQLKEQKCLEPRLAWAQEFLATQRTATPAAVLLQTAQYRLLASNITTSISFDSQTSLPVDIASVTIKERKLGGDVVVQVLNVENLSRGRWDQIQSIEAQERGETVKGREVIRVISSLQDGAPEPEVRATGTHKVLLQDAASRLVHGVEVQNIEGLSTAMKIGTKLLLRKGLVCNRGLLMLEPNTVRTLGGKIDALHEAWSKQQKACLQEQLGSTD